MTRIERIFDCPMYSDCLMELAIVDAKVFTCKDCKKDKEADMPRDTVKTGPEVFKRLMGRLKEKGWTITDLIRNGNIPKSNIYNINKYPLMERAVIAKIASAVDMDIEQLLYNGGIKAAIAQAFDSQAIAEDKNKAVGKQNEVSPESEAPKPKRKNHPLCIAVGCTKIQARGKYCCRHHRELMIDKASKPVEVEFTPVAEQPGAVKTLEFYELKENGRQATIVFSKGSFSHCKFDGLNDDKWTFEDWEFIGTISKEIRRLMQA